MLGQRIVLDVAVQTTEFVGSDNKEKSASSAR